MDVPTRDRATPCYLLDEDRELGRLFEPAERMAVRQLATAPVALFPAGPASLQQMARDGLGLLVLDGLLVREVEVAGRTAAELLGPGDLLRPWDQEGGTLVAESVTWRVLEPCRFALLDDRFALRTRGWPKIGDTLMRRLTRRAQSLAAQQAIAAHPRVEERVGLLLAHLADRWGVVEADGHVRLPMPITHRLLGELVGAERPSVSVAVGRLRKSGQLGETGDGDLLLKGRLAEMPADEPVPAWT